jgi:hypothetical protein
MFHPQHLQLEHAMVESTIQPMQGAHNSPAHIALVERDTVALPAIPASTCQGPSDSARCDRSNSRTGLHVAP